MLKNILKSQDYKLIISLVVLCLIGLVMVYSSSMITAITRYHVPTDYFYKKQMGALILGFFLFFATAFFVPYKIFKEKAVIISILMVSFLLLGLVLVLGHTAGGAKSWITIGPLRIQPLEIAKLAVIVYLASAFTKKQEYINQLTRAFIPPIIIVMLICFLLAAQPDYGGVLLMLGTVAALVFCSGISVKTGFKIFFITLIGTSLMTFVIWVTGKVDKILSPTRLGRFTGFVDPFADPDGKGYQLVNSYLAIGSGGLGGEGLGQGVQKFGYLPESHTDFIMAVISEELGFAGVIVVLGLLFFIVLQGLLIAKRCSDPFGSLLAIGISTMIGIQSFVNLGAVSGILPITGVTLPFVSYGGSSITLLLFSTGVLANISMVDKFKKKYKQSTTKPTHLESV
ncbi:putative lipid II flippase FtsW [Priestia sp. SB1]|uniref:putative lipid II flippase FtsW n=1 Tax=Priestia sp. SB1 TaxID=3132359 RepID=UPI003175BCEE